MDRNVFIVGCPRSGTTFVQSFLAAHPDVYATPETQFFIELLGYQNLTRRVQPASMSMHIRGFLTAVRVSLGIAQGWGADVRREVRYFLRNSGHVELLEAFPRFDPRMRVLADAFLGIVERLCEQSGKQVWVEKSPNHLFAIDAIEVFVRDSLFVHVLRGGQATVASLKDASLRYPDTFWKIYSDVERCTKRWNACVDQSLQYCGKDNHYLLRYEDLVARPRATLEGVCRFVGVAYSESMIDDRSEAAKQITYAAEKHKHNVHDTEIATGEKFATVLSESERDYVNAQLHDIDWAAIANSNASF